LVEKSRSLEYNYTVSKTNGGNIMETLAERLRDEGKKIGVKGAKLEIDRELIKNSVEFSIISRSSGFSIEEIEKKDCCNCSLRKK
jgi:hypothetical protein